MALRRKPTKRGPISLVKVAERTQASFAEKLRKVLAQEFASTAKQWRLEAKRLLGGQCASKGHPNETDFPGRCSGDLERSLSHRTYVLRRQVTSVNAGWARQFEEFSRPATQNSGAFNYGAYLDRSNRSYGNYRQRIYNSLDKRMKEVLIKYSDTDIGRSAWLHT